MADKPNEIQIPAEGRGAAGPDWEIDLAKREDRVQVQSAKDLRSPEKIAKDLNDFLSRPETQQSNPQFNDRYVARNIYRALYHLSPSEVESVETSFKNLATNGETLSQIIDRQVPKYSETFKRLKELNSPTGIEEGQMVDAAKLLKDSADLKIGEFQTVTIKDQGMDRRYSVFIPEKVDKRGLLIMGLDGVRQDDNKQYLDFEAQLTLRARNTGSIVMIPHHEAGDLKYKPTLRGELAKYFSQFAGKDRVFDKDVLSDPELTDPKLLYATKDQIRDRLHNTHFWNMPESKQNLFIPSARYDDAKFVMHAWQDLKDRLELADKFGMVTFSNGGLVAQELMKKTDKIGSAVLFMSPRMKDSFPEHGTNLMFVFADGDATLNPSGGPGWPRGWTMDKNTTTNLKNNVPVTEFERFSESNKCDGKPIISELTPNHPYKEMKFQNCREGELSIYKVPSPYGHAVPSNDNLNLAQWSRPAPTDLAQKGYQFVLDNLKKELEKSKAR